MRMMAVSQKNTSGQQQPVSLVLVSAKGRVAVYDLSLKLAAAFTLRLSSAPVASIKTPLSIPAAGTSVSNRPISAAATSSHNATSSQKVFFFCAFNVELQCTFLHPFHPSSCKMRKKERIISPAREKTKTVGHGKYSNPSA